MPAAALDAARPSRARRAGSSRSCSGGSWGGTAREQEREQPRGPRRAAARGGVAPAEPVRQSPLVACRALRPEYRVLPAAVGGAVHQQLVRDRPGVRAQRRGRAVNLPQHRRRYARRLQALAQRRVARGRARRPDVHQRGGAARASGPRGRAATAALRDRPWTGARLRREARDRRVVLHGAILGSRRHATERRVGATSWQRRRVPHRGPDSAVADSLRAARPGRWPREPDRRLPRRWIHVHRAFLESCAGRVGVGSGGRAEWIALRARADGGRRHRRRGDQRGAHLPGAARLVADRAARRTIRDPSGGHTRDAECRGAGAARRGITLNLGTGHYGALDGAAGGSPAPHRRATSRPEIHADSHSTPAAPLTIWTDAEHFWGMSAGRRRTEERVSRWNVSACSASRLTRLPNAISRAYST